MQFHNIKAFEIGLLKSFFLNIMKEKRHVFHRKNIQKIIIIHINSYFKKRFGGFHPKSNTNVKYSTMKLSNFLRVTVLFLLLGCQSEDPATPIQIADSYLEPVSLTEFNDARLLNLKVDWESGVTGKMNGADLKEWTISDDNKAVFYNLLRIDEGEDEKFFVLHYWSHDDIGDFSYISGREKITGTINWMNMAGEIVALEAFDKGDRVNLTKTEDMEKTSALGLSSRGCGPGTAWKTDLNKEGKLPSNDDCEYGYYVTVTTSVCSDWYFDRGNLGWEYAYRTDERKTYTREWVSNGRDYADATSIHGGSVVRAVNAANGSRITNLATLELINAETDGGLLVPSCQSFEYANGPTVKAAGVTGISEYFYWIQSAKDLPPGHTPDVRIIELGIATSYFILPKVWTNGTAANQTALALEAATYKTQIWFAKNGHYIGSNRLASEWENNIKNAMRLMGGDFKRRAPFPIPHLAPYKEDFTFWRTNCSS